jgi:hypothetical protein
MHDIVGIGSAPRDSLFQESVTHNVGQRIWFRARIIIAPIPCTYWFNPATKLGCAGHFVCNTHIFRSYTLATKIAAFIISSFDV